MHIDEMGQIGCDTLKTLENQAKKSNFLPIFANLWFIACPLLSDLGEILLGLWVIVRLCVIQILLGSHKV